MSGHVDVEQDHRELALQQQRSASRPEAASTHVDVELAEHAREGEPLLRPVVDHQDVGAPRGGLAHV